VLTWEQWRQKSKSSLEAGRILLERNKPVEAASRSYYAAYQMVTGVLLKLGLNPRSSYGNWSHHETLEMYQTHVCKKVNLGFREQQALKNLFRKFRALLGTRYLADYGDSSVITLSSAQSLWRDANRLVSLLSSLIQRGLL
jgi:uncharacterized protein (UPF0332 family)